MKILLCTLTIGEGLNRICQAVSGELNKLNIENEVFNVYEKDKEREKFNKDFYYKIAKLFPNLLSFFQKKLSNINRKFRWGWIPKTLKREIDATKEILQKKYEEEKYHVLYTPVAHIALSALALKKEGFFNIHIVYQIPDFNIPIGIENALEIDKIITPCEEIEKRFIESGKFDKKQISNIGFPISEKFFKQHNKKEICQKLSIDNDILRILIMSGGFGFGKTSKLIKRLAKEKLNIHYIVVNGNNKEEKDKIDGFIAKNKLKNVTNYGYCTNVDELMAISDAVFTKVGSVTMCEASAKNIPLIAIKQKLYPEQDNLAYLKMKKAIIYCKNINMLCKKLQILEKDKSEFLIYKKNISELFSFASTQKIAKCLVDLTESINAI